MNFGVLRSKDGPNGGGRQKVKRIQTATATITITGANSDASDSSSEDEANIKFQSAANGHKGASIGDTGPDQNHTSCNGDAKTPGTQEQNHYISPTEHNCNTIDSKDNLNHSDNGHRYEKTAESNTDRPVTDINRVSKSWERLSLEHQQQMHQEEENESALRSSGGSGNVLYCLILSCKVKLTSDT